MPKYSAVRKTRFNLDSIRPGDITIPSGGKWENMLAAIVPLLEHGNPAQFALAVQQLKSMAIVADTYVTSKTPGRKPANLVDRASFQT